MALKTLVKIGNVSNLSDARYCAGMGVDMLGFVTIAGQPNYVSPQLYQDIRGWVAGPLIVAELYGLQTSNSLPGVLNDYRPDYLEVGMSELPLISSSELPLIVSIENADELKELGPVATKIHYLQIKENAPTLIRQAGKSFPTILSLASVSGLQLLEEFSLKGIAINGSPEVRPGYKDYGDLADVLEQLEED